MEPEFGDQGAGKPPIAKRRVARSTLLPLSPVAPALGLSGMMADLLPLLAEHGRCVQLRSPWSLERLARRAHFCQCTCSAGPHLGGDDSGRRALGDSHAPALVEPDATLPGESGLPSASRFTIAPSGLRVIIHQQEGAPVPSESTGVVAPLESASRSARASFAAAATVDTFSGLAENPPSLVVPAPLQSTRARRIVFFREAPAPVAPPAPSPRDLAESSRNLSSLSLDDSHVAGADGGEGHALAFAAGEASLLSCSDEVASPATAVGGTRGAASSAAISGVSSGGFAVSPVAAASVSVDLSSTPPSSSAASAPPVPTPRRLGAAAGVGIAGIGMSRVSSSDSLNLLSPASAAGGSFAVGGGLLDSPRAPLPPLPLQRSGSARFGVALLATATGELVAPSRRNVVAPALARTLSDRESDIRSQQQQPEQQQTSRTSHSHASTVSAR